MKQFILLLVALLSTPTMHGMRHVIASATLKRMSTHQITHPLVTRYATQSSSASHQQKKELAKKLIELKKAEIKLTESRIPPFIQLVAPVGAGFGTYTLLEHVIPKSIEYADVLACSGGIGIYLTLHALFYVYTSQLPRKNYEKAYDDFVSCAFETNQEHLIAKEKEDL